MEYSSGADEILKVLKFSYFQQVSLTEQLAFYSALFLVLGLIALGIRRHLLKEKAKETEFLKQDYKAKEKKTLQTIITNLQLSAHEHKLLEQIAGASDFRKLYALIESAARFEKKVEAFKQKQPHAKLWSHIFALRHKLGFHANNPRTPFLCTQMLRKGMRLECSAHIGSKQILFISPIVNITEKHLYIKPPTNQGQPVSLKRLSYLMGKLRRGEEIYEFKLYITKQIFGRVNHVVLEHTHEVKQIVEREFERVPLQIFTTLYQLSEAQLSLPTKALNRLKEEQALPFWDGTLIDLSLGGANLVTSDDLETLGERDIVILTIPGVQVRDHFQARVLAIVPQQGKFHLHLQFLPLKDIERLKLNKFLIRMKKKAEEHKTTAQAEE